MWKTRRRPDETDLWIVLMLEAQIITKFVPPTLNQRVVHLIMRENENTFASPKGAEEGDDARLIFRIFSIGKNETGCSFLLLCSRKNEKIWKKGQKMKKKNRKKWDWLLFPASLLSELKHESASYRRLPFVQLMQNRKTWIWTIRAITRRGQKRVKEN